MVEEGWGGLLKSTGRPSQIERERGRGRGRERGGEGERAGREGERKQQRAGKGGAWGNPSQTKENAYFGWGQLASRSQIAKFNKNSMLLLCGDYAGFQGDGLEF